MNVKYILVDPSCSGSGIYNRQEYNKVLNALFVGCYKTLRKIKCKRLGEDYLFIHMFAFYCLGDFH